MKCGLWSPKMRLVIEAAWGWGLSHGKGFGGVTPEKFFKIYTQNGDIWWILRLIHKVSGKVFSHVSYHLRSYYSRPIATTRIFRLCILLNSQVPWLLVLFVKLSSFSMLNSGETSAKTLVLVHLLSKPVDLAGSMEPIISSVYVTLDAFDFIVSLAGVPNCNW